MRTPWTRLEGTALWNAARAAHDAQPWRRYHGFSHPMHLYGLARDIFGFSHDIQLDRAILAHDVVQGGPTPVEDSVAWLEAHCPDPLAARLIMSTQDHRPVPGGDNRLILLDLADFAFAPLRRRNTLLLEEEKRLETGCDRDAFTMGTRSYLSGLLSRVREGSRSLDIQEAGWFAEISSGIEATLSEMAPSEQLPPEARSLPDPG